MTGSKNFGFEKGFFEFFCTDYKLDCRLSKVGSNLNIIVLCIVIMFMRQHQSPETLFQC